MTTIDCSCGRTFSPRNEQARCHHCGRLLVAAIDGLRPGDPEAIRRFQMRWLVRRASA